MYSGETNPRLWFRVWEDGEPVTTITIGDLAIVVHRPGITNPSALSLTLTTDETSTTVGAVYHVGGGLCWVNISTASISSYQGPIVCEGTYTDGSVDGIVAEVSAYDTAGNPNTTTPPTAAAIADAVWDEPRADHTTAGTYGEFSVTVGNVTVASFTAAALLQLVEEDTGETTATAGSVARIAQGSAADITSELQTIIAQTSLISAAKIDVVSPVTTGGTITIKRGSDYRVRNGTAINLKVVDTGGALHTILTDTDQVSSILLGAADANQTNRVTGTIAVADLVYASDELTLPIEIISSEILSAAGDLEYHIKTIAPVVSGDTAGDECVRIEGCMVVENERRTP